MSCRQHPDPRTHLEPPESNLHHLNRSFRSFIAVNLNLFSHMLSSGFIIRNAWRASVNKGSVGAWLDILSTDNTQLREPTLLLVDIRGWGGTGLRVSNPEGTFDGIGWSLRVCALLTVDLVGLSRVVDASRAEFVSPLCVCVFHLYYLMLLPLLEVKNLQHPGKLFTWRRSFTDASCTGFKTASDFIRQRP